MPKSIQHTIRWNLERQEALNFRDGQAHKNKIESRYDRDKLILVIGREEKASIYGLVRRVMTHEHN